MVPIGIGGKNTHTSFRFGICIRGICMDLYGFCWIIPVINLTHRASNRQRGLLCSKLEKREAKDAGIRPLGSLEVKKNDETWTNRGIRRFKDVEKVVQKYTSHVAWYSGLQIASLALFEIR